MAGADARLPVHAEAQFHASRLHGEERLIPAGQRAAAEGHAEGAGAVVRLLCQPFDLVQGVARAALAPASLNTKKSPEIPRRSAACSMGAEATSSLTRTVRTSSPFALGSAPGHVEVEHVARIVAVAVEHAALARCGPGHPIDLFG